MKLEEKIIEIEEHFNLWLGNYNRKEPTTDDARFTGIRSPQYSQRPSPIQSLPQFL